MIDLCSFNKSLKTEWVIVGSCCVRLHVPLEIKRTFDQFTLAHSSLILNFIAEGHL